MKPRLRVRIPRWLAANQIGLSLLLLCVLTEETAWRLRGDASYDLLNYHLYGPFALLHGKWGRDLAPAQTQTFLAPTNDIAYYLLARHIPSVHVLHLLLAIPASTALCLAFLITLRLISAAGIVERLIALLAVLIAGNGAAAHTVLAMSMSDMTPCSLMLGAILLLLRPRASEADPGLLRHVLPGLLVGTALGLKLTFSYATAGLVAGLLVRSDIPGILRLRLTFLYCISVAMGALAVGGWWWVFLWRTTGNPLFPMYNNLFHSPLAPFADFVDMRFFPRTLMQRLFYPFFWAVDRTPLVTEPDLPMRDPRMALALLAAIALLLRSLRARPAAAGPARFVAVFFLASFALWEHQFSIFRYLSILELLSGTMLAMLAVDLVRSEQGRRLVLVVMIVLFAALRPYTVTPNWGRQADRGGVPLPVHVLRLPPDSLVLILDWAPLAYVALFEPDSVRFMGANNNLTRPELGGLLQSRIHAAIAAQRQHLYGLEKPDYAPGAADRTLAAYGLHRVGCEPVTGAIVGSGTRLCALAP